MPERPDLQSGVSIRGLRKSYPGLRQRQQVLNGVSLQLGPGEVVGLIGPNGAGKTTLMSCLLGFLHPDEGEIAFDGLANDDLTVRRRIGYVPERVNFGRGATGLEFVTYMARLSGIGREEARRRALEMLERLGLSGAGGKDLTTYSRGMLQRAALAQALLHRPDYLFLDEPASGLDPAGVLLVRDLIAEEKSRGAMVLLNSHQLAEVEKVCDRVLFLQAGRIERSETLRHQDRHVMAIRLLAGSYDPEAVRLIAGSVPRNDVVTVSGATEVEVASFVSRLVNSGAGVVEVRPETADLEALFRGER